MIIEDSNSNNILKIKDNALLADNLEKWIKQLNHLGGILFEDSKTGKRFEIKEI